MLAKRLAQDRHFIPAALGSLKKVVTAFVGKLGLPFCQRRQVEEELSKSITLALLESSNQSMQESSEIMDLSSI